MDDIRIELDGDIEDKVRKLPEVKSAAREAVDKIAAIARETAPVVLGDYKAGIITQETRTGWRVQASDQKSAWVEFGIPSHNQPPQFILRRAAEAAGFKFSKKGG
jgi:hypothetical protein